MSQMLINLSEALHAKIKAAAGQQGVSVTKYVITSLEQLLDGRPVELIDINTYHHECKRCGHKWSNNKEQPNLCLSCKSYQWRTVKPPSKAALKALSDKYGRYEHKITTNLLCGSGLIAKLMGYPDLDAYHDEEITEDKLQRLIAVYEKHAKNAPARIEPEKEDVAAIDRRQIRFADFYTATGMTPSEFKEVYGVSDDQFKLFVGGRCSDAELDSILG